MPTLVASDRPCGDLSQGRRWPLPARWRRTPASDLENPFRRASRNAVGSGSDASGAGPHMHF